MKTPSFTNALKIWRHLNKISYRKKSNSNIQNRMLRKYQVLKYPRKGLNSKRFPMFTITHDFFDGKIRKKGIIHQIRSRWDITVATVNEKQIFIQFLVQTKINFIKNQIIKIFETVKKA